MNYNEVKKEKIEEHIFFNHYKDMKEEIEKSKKMEKVKHEDLTSEQKDMHSKSVEYSRTQLRIRLEMLDSSKDNYWTKYRTLGPGQEDRDPGLRCGDCGHSRDSQSHCLVCPAWLEARERLDLSCIEDVVIYFQRVLKGQEEKKDKERKERIRKEKENKEQERTGGQG